MSKPLQACVYTAVGAFILTACGTGGSDTGGDKNLPNRGFVPYTFSPAKVGQTNPFVAENSVTFRTPMAILDGDKTMVYAARCPGDSPCEIVAASLTTNHVFGTLQTVCTDDAGLEHPMVTTHGSAATLWLIANQGREIRSAPLDAQGKCGAFSRHRTAEPDQQFFALNVIRDGAAILLVYGQQDSDRRRWVVHAIGEITSRPLFDCNVDELCTNSTQWVDLELRAAQTALGRKYWRGLALRSGGRSRTAVDYFTQNEQLVVAPYPFRPAFEVDFVLESASQLRVGDQFLMFGERAGSIIFGVNADGAPSDRF
ncbi:MAG: hypothetical protein VX589_11325 [Myxococcota bacterium]|nr:hypothetical protein [Myxococcota bacterium]